VIDGYELENAAGTDLENIEGNRITFKPESRGEGEFPAYVINTFTTLSSGIKGVTPAKVIVKDLIVAGQLRTTTMGIYVNGGNSKPTGAIEGEATDPAAFDTEWNFVKMYGLEIIPYLGKNRDLPYRPEGIGAAVACYGNAVLNYCMVKGTVASEDVATREDLVGIPLYDMASANAATVTLNNSEVGSIYTWEQSTWILNASNVNWINWKALNVSALNKYLTLSNGSHINTLFVNTATPDNQYVPKLNVDETSSIDVLVIKPNFNYANAITRNSFSNVADGTIGKVIVDGTVADGVVSGGTEMTWAEFKANYLTK
jgi:hypothetical protein